MAVWVAYRVTPESIGPSKTRTWAADPWLAPEERIEPEDYDDASDALKIDRGHQTPLAAFSGTSFWAQTNNLSNITPQSSELNQGPWQRLEAKETQLSRSANRAIYILTGPLFETLMAPMPTFRACYGKQPDLRGKPITFEVIDAQAGTSRKITLKSGSEIGAGLCSEISFDVQLGCDAALELLPDAALRCDERNGVAWNEPASNRKYEVVATLLNPELTPGSCPGQ